MLDRQAFCKVPAWLSVTDPISYQERINKTYIHLGITFRHVALPSAYLIPIPSFAIKGEKLQCYVGDPQVAYRSIEDDLSRRLFLRLRETKYFWKQGPVLLAKKLYKGCANRKNVILLKEHQSNPFVRFSLSYRNVLS